MGRTGGARNGSSGKLRKGAGGKCTLGLGTACLTPARLHPCTLSVEQVHTMQNRVYAHLSCSDCTGFYIGWGFARVESSDVANTWGGFSSITAAVAPCMLQTGV